jgi:hypothetical protein
MGRLRSGEHTCNTLFSTVTWPSQLFSTVWGDVKPSVSSNGVHSIPDANAVEVCVVVWVVVVVGDVVTDVLVGEVVGVVTTHPWNPPAVKASIIALTAAAVVAQPPSSTTNAVPKQVTVIWDPSGPPNSVTAALSALAVAAHPSLSSSTSMSDTPTWVAHLI